MFGTSVGGPATFKEKLLPTLIKAGCAKCRRDCKVKMSEGKESSLKSVALALLWQMWGRSVR